MAEIITPEIPKGTRDFLPKDMAKRSFVMEKIREVFINFGYDTIQTPVIEYAKTILGKYGDEEAKLTYTFNDKGGRKLALRYDQTVPFARFVATYYPDLPMPFKRYQISRVWRADKPAKGRYREFYQCDIDIIGADSLLAEGEICKVICAVLENLGFSEYRIKFNSRHLLNRILKDLHVPAESQIEAIRTLDKIDKIGFSKVTQSLQKLLSKEITEKLVHLVKFQGTNQEKIDFLRAYEPDEIRKFLLVCDAFGIDESKLEFDVSLARGLDYYTGITFEVHLDNVEIGPVCAGGRYDDLCSMFCKKTFSGVGAAFGFERLMLAMEDLELLREIGSHAQVLVTCFDNSTLQQSLNILNDLRESGIKAELYLEPDRLSKQVKYADKKEIPFVIICGPDEASRGEATIKVMKTGKQKTIPQSQLPIYFQGYHYAG